MPPYLQLDTISKSFGDTRVLSGVSLAVDESRTLALLGPSGSGKTTLLRLIAGFEIADSGRIEVGGADVTRLSPARRRFGMVFQHYALFPHLTVARNVAFGLEARGVPAAERDDRIAEVLRLVDLPGFGGRSIHELSGGQQQRVALARALAPRPRLLLLDEPLSNLDRTLRERTRRDLRQTLERIGITAVWVTHEQEEAFDVGDCVAVLERGRLEQVGRPEELYMRPASRFVAGFVGRASAVAGRLGEDGRVRVGATGEMDRPGDAAAGGEPLRWAGEAAGDPAPGAAVELVFRPEALELAPPGTAGALSGRITDRRYGGSQTFYTVETAGGQHLEVLADGQRLAPGDETAVRPRAGGPPARIFER